MAFAPQRTNHICTAVRVCRQNADTIWVLLRSRQHPSSRCPVCERPALLRRSDVSSYALRACPECGLEFLDPQPDDSVLAAIYNDGYFLGEGSNEAAERRSKMKRATGALYIDALTGLIRPENTALLEIGCGHGEALLEARNRGFRVSGIEISAHAAAIANRFLGTQTVSVGTIETLPLARENFGAVVAADVIEHVRDPEGWLLRIHELLIPGGALLLIAPSLDSWTRRLLRSRWMEYKVEHLYYFSAMSIRRLLGRCGFDETRISPSRKVLTIEYLSSHFDRFRVPILSPLVSLLRRAVPSRIAHRHLLVSASGLMAVARKTGARRPK
jgi:SAM-dependent methyltransferase